MPRWLMNIADVSWHDARLYYRAVLHIRDALVISFTVIGCRFFGMPSIIEFTVNT
jgi:hypothetical protein